MVPAASGPLPRVGPYSGTGSGPFPLRSEEHTSELQSLRHLVCRLLHEKKKRRSHSRRPRKQGTTHARPPPRGASLISPIDPREVGATPAAAPGGTTHRPSSTARQAALG